jgi:Ca-activated chloride channel family protein
VLVFEYLWAFFLLPLPFLIWLIAPPFREQQQALKIPFFEEAARAAGLKPSRGAIVMKRSVLQWFLALIVWGLVVTSLARPQWVEDPIEKIQSARDIMLAIDLSQSMEANDFIDRDSNRIDRLEAVKQVVDEFITRREGDRIGLVVYGAAAYPQVPFTLDHESVRILLDETEIGMAGPRTAIGDAIGLSIRLFEASEVEEKVLILLTDGNDTSSKMPPDKAADIAAAQGIVIHTIGIGNPETTGEEQVDLEALQKIAETTGGRSFRGEDQEGLKSIYATLDEMTPKNYEVFSYRPKIPLFHWPLGAAVSLLLLFEIGMILRFLIPRILSTGSEGTVPGEAQ